MSSAVAGVFVAVLCLWGMNRIDDWLRGRK